MATFYIGQRVHTGKYGHGTVSGFERIESVVQPITYPTEYAEGDRIAVKLDNPTLWGCHSVTDTDPYFVARELTS